MLKIDTTILVNELTEVIEVLIDKKLKFPHNNTPTVLTESEASDYFKVGKRTLLNMRKSGVLPKDSYFYIGRSVRYKKENLISCFSNNTI